MMMRPYECDILEAIVKAERCKWFEISDLSGYSDGSVDRALALFKRRGLIERVSGALEATDRGKIILAIAMGKEARKRARQRVA